MRQFLDGDKIAEISFADSSRIVAGKDCTEIVVSIETGLMDCSLWFCVMQDGMLASKWNGRMVEGVSFYGYKPTKVGA